MQLSLTIRDTELGWFAGYAHEMSRRRTKKTSFISHYVLCGCTSLQLVEFMEMETGRYRLPFASEIYTRDYIS